MKKVAVALFVVFATALAAYASDCQSTTYDQYLGSGFNCGINDQTYANFGYTGTSNPPGFSMPAGSIAVTPITTPNNPGLQFSAGWSANTITGILEQTSTFDYSVTSVSPITDLSLSIAGVGFSGTGLVTLDETACLGAMLPACSGGTIVTLSVYDSSGGQQLYNQVNFSGVNLVSIAEGLQVQSGTNGGAEVSIITNQFSETSTTPEPGTLSMFGAGVLAVAGFARRKFKI